MNKQILRYSLVAFFVSALLFSCQKHTIKDKADFETEAAVQSDDQSHFAAQIDATSNEINAVLEATGTLAARGGSIQDIVCNATVAVDSANAIRTITITYNGADCLNGFTRTGIVLVSIPAGVHWKNAGAAITVQYQNVVVKRISDNKSITIHGSHVITNASGGLLVNLSNLNSVTHTITSDGMTVTFTNGVQRTWKVAKQRVFTYSGGIVITTTGLHAEGGVNDIAEWGTNRYGRSFVSIISQPLVIKQDCAFRLTSGEIKHIVSAFTATVTFGLNANGEVASCPGLGHYYCKIIWTGAAGNPHTVIFPY